MATTEFVAEVGGKLAAAREAVSSSRLQHARVDMRRSRARGLALPKMTDPPYAASSGGFKKYPVEASDHGCDRRTGRGGLGGDRNSELRARTERVAMYRIGARLPAPAHILGEGRTCGWLEVCSRGVIPNRPQFLGVLESELMELFWSGGDGNIKAIHSVLNERRPRTEATIHSTLRRLVAKGFLEREKIGRAWVYRARMNRDQFRGMVKRMSFAP